MDLFAFGFLFKLILGSNSLYFHPLVFIVYVWLQRILELCWLLILEDMFVPAGLVFLVMYSLYLKLCIFLVLMEISV